MSRIAIYSRKSKETDTGESIKNQIQMCKDYFLRRDEKHSFEVFQDEGFSGGNTNRPQFKRMMLLAKHNQFDIIACYKIDRIGRNIVDFMNTFDILQKHNVSLVSITEGFDPDTPAGRMMMTMIAGFAEMERMNIAQRVKDNMEALAKLGRWSGGTCPTGYRSIKINNGEKYAMYLELIPDWKNKLIEIFSLAADGMTCNAIGKKLNMSNKSIANIINNPVYCKSSADSKSYLESIGYKVYGDYNENGYIAYNRRPKAKNGKKLFNAENMFATVSIHEAPIPSQMWIKANINIKSRGQEKRPRVSQYSWLAHLVKCSCGSGMFVTPGRTRKDGSRYYYFCCSSRKYNKNCSEKRVNATFLEEDILEILKSILSDKKIIKNYVNNLSTKDNTYEINSLKSDIKKYNKMLNSLADKLALLENNASLAILDKMNLISAKIDSLNKELLKLEQENILNNLDEVNTDLLLKEIKEFIDNFELLDIDKKQFYIQNISKEIALLKNGKFKIKFNI